MLARRALCWRCQGQAPWGMRHLGARSRRLSRGWLSPQQQRGPCRAASLAASQGVLVVESPAKAKKISGFVPEFQVLPTYGHVRDLPAKKGAVDPANDFAAVWQVYSRSYERLDAIADALQGSRRLVLATDPDREGEAIAWHLLEELRSRRLLRGVSVARITFTEITEQAVRAALGAPRNLAQPLVEAALARRALDHLLGFELSGVLWRKLRGAKAAGRVQSVALRFVAERDAEIALFRATTTYDVVAVLATAAGHSFEARLSQVEGKTIKARGGFVNLEDATAAVEELRAAALQAGDKSESTTSRSPPPPFTTSTMLRSASSSLGFSTTVTTRSAQELHEDGLCTYIRTDSVGLSEEAIVEIRAFIRSTFGSNYGTPKPRVYRGKQLNAQEAHEGIRPTDFGVAPDRLPREQPERASQQLRLYTLLFCRAVASQMADAKYAQGALTVVTKAGRALQLRASCSEVAFPGFLAVGQRYPLRGPRAGGPLDPLGAGTARDDEGGALDSDSDSDDDEGRPPGGKKGRALSMQLLRSIAVGDDLTLVRADVSPVTTKPPPHLSDAGLIKVLEAAGVGRPSTYAPTLNRLQDHGYVTRQQRRLAATARGQAVAAYLRAFFPRYVDPAYTATVEAGLDDITRDASSRLGVLRDFWGPFSANVAEAGGVTMRAVFDQLDAELAPLCFPPAPVDPDASGPAPDPRQCPACGEGRLSLKPSDHLGAFIGCSRYPDCQHTRNLVNAPPDPNDPIPPGQNALELGVDPATGFAVSLRRGPYGLYYQMTGADGSAQRRATYPSRPPQGDPEGEAQGDNVGPSLEEALALMVYPKDIGIHPAYGVMIQANTGKYGPYMQLQGIFASLPKGEGELDDVSLERAIELIDAKVAAKQARAKGGKVKGLPPLKGQGGPEGEAGPGRKRGRAKGAKAAGGSADRPKRPLSAYLLYGQQRRPQLKAEQPQLTAPQVMSALAAEWRALDPAEKAGFEAAAAEASQAARAAPAKGAAKGRKAAKAAARSSKRQGSSRRAKGAAGAEVERPKRGLNAYMLFSQQRRPQLTAEQPGLAPSQVVSALAAEWRALGPGEKAAYSAAPAAEGSSQAALAVGSSSNGAAPRSKGAATGRQRRSSSGSSRAGRAGGAGAEGPGRPLNAYLAYGQQRRPQLKAEQPDLTPSQIISTLAAEWRELDPREKAEYGPQAVKA